MNHRQQREEPKPSFAIVVDEGYLGPEEVAQHLGISRSTLNLRTRDGTIPSRKTKRGYRYPPSVLDMHAEQVRPSAIREAATGKRDARCISLFRQGKTMEEVCEETETAYALVEDLFKRWLHGREFEAKTRAHACRCGKASDPRTAQCADCFNRSRVLGPRQVVAHLSDDGETVIIGGKYYLLRENHGGRP